MTNEEMRAASGYVNGSSLLEVFLYHLMRDHLTPGVIEALVMEIEKPGWTPPAMFTNGWLAQYAKNLAARLAATKE